MKRFKNFINEKVNNKKVQVELLLSYLENNTEYRFVEYGEEFDVEKFEYNSKFKSILYLMINENNIDYKKNKAIRFNYTNFNIYSIDMWEDFEFHLEEGESIYNKPSYELTVPSNIINITSDILSFINGDFKEEIQESKTNITESPEERVSSIINELDDYDLDPFEAIKYNVLQVAFNQKTTSFILSGLGGMGKCLAKGTQVIMADGKIKNVEDIKNGEFVLGVDSKPKKVSGVNSGISEMYEVQQKSGINYTVNKDHILSLKNYKTFKKEDGVVNISIEDYLKKDKKWKEVYHGYNISYYTTEINLVEKPIDEYYGFTVVDSLFLLKDTTVVHNTYDVKKTLEDVHKQFKYFKGNSSPAGLYELLFLYRHDLIVLDDMDDVLTSKDTRDILKAVLDTGEKRELDRRLKGYFNAVGWTDDEIQEEHLKTGKLPNKFEFTGSIIFITNLKEEDIDPVIFTRTLHIDISLEHEEIMARIKSILPHMHPTVPIEDKEETLTAMVDLLDTYVSKAPLNLRTLYHCINFKISNDNLTKKVAGQNVPLWILLVKKFLVRNMKLKDVKE